MLALKRSSNKETFKMIKKCFDISLQEFYADGKKVSKVNLDTSVDKLRIKYRNLKTSWSKENNRIKKKTGKKNPKWYRYHN